MHLVYLWYTPTCHSDWSLARSVTGVHRGVVVYQVRDLCSRKRHFVPFLARHGQRHHGPSLPDIDNVTAPAQNMIHTGRAAGLHAAAAAAAAHQR